MTKLNVMVMSLYGDKYKSGKVYSFWNKSVELQNLSSIQSNCALGIADNK